MKTFFSSLLIFTICSMTASCGDQTPAAQEFPIFQTLEPKQIDESGATFRGIVSLKGLSEPTSYGFVWDHENPTVEESNKIELTDNFELGVFESRVNHSLVNDITYNIRAYAVLQNNKTIYGNQVSFESKGSARASWIRLVNESSLIPQAPSFGHNTNQSGYVIFYNGRLFKFNPISNSFSEQSNIPVTIDQNSFRNHFVIASKGETIYYISNGFNDILKYENDRWSIIGQLSRGLGSSHFHYVSIVVEDELVILGNRYSYAFNLVTETWRELNEIPSPLSLAIASVTLGNKVYIMTRDKRIWEFDIINDQWTLKTTFPGSIIHEQPVSFSHQNRIYFGLNPGGDLSQDADGILWSYDLVRDEWIEEEPLPETQIGFQNFYFLLHEKFYFANPKSGNVHDLWSFDPTIN